MRAGFRTALQNVPESERREECLDLACHEKGGTLVAQGVSSHDGVELAVKIREYRHHPDQSEAGLEGIAARLLEKGLDDREIRLVAGAVAGRPLVEQWSIVNPCSGEIGGRVLVSLSDKVVEIEAVAKGPRDEAKVRQAVADIVGVLHGVRIRRIGEASVDPAADAPPIKEIMEAVVSGCF